MTESHLHASQLDRIRRSKIALKSRLQAMQARVEPQFLFNTLSQVERLYEVDEAIAQRMLDDLTGYPFGRMSQRASTLASDITQMITLRVSACQSLGIGRSGAEK